MIRKFPPWFEARKIFQFSFTFSASSVHCINCFKVGVEEHCPACGFPLCQTDCSRAESHSRECRELQELGYRYEGPRTYSALTVLRLLLLMEREGREGGGLIGKMMDHNEERRTEHPELWDFETEFVVRPLQERLGLAARFSEEQIRRAAGILATNSTSLQGPSQLLVKGIGLYPVYSMMNHSCTCNTKTIIDSSNNYAMTVLAHVDIKAGEEITNQYIKPDRPTLYRRPFLRRKWYFDCLCPRCLDPTELGSHLSSLLCARRGCGGTLLVCSTTTSQSDWACLRCGLTVSNEEAFNILELATNIHQEVLDRLDTKKSDEKENEINDFLSNGNTNGRTQQRETKKPVDRNSGRITRDLYLLEEALFRLSPLLHHHNYFNLQLQLRLIDLYAALPELELSRTAVQRQVQLCSEVTDCLTRVNSGYSSWRTKILPALATARIRAAGRDLQEGSISKGRFDKLVLENRFIIMYLAYQQAKVKI